ncbi:MAG: ACT domain-containing protein [Candidatus Bathyarchaeota archaeon]|nr:ACT domain-containing protein [Candidatus Bathyarchaeota archaeon]MCX8176751.1 ACT domain-containing protein [Candidatus Bathyarchaeota archaeon]MDW8193280.1 ACT domain-containing protein [Nitrososphaerota archaeon]
MTTAQRVRDYLKDRPYILEALEKSIVNLSELSRQIQNELKIESLPAVKAALRRFKEELQKRKHRREERVLKLLKESTITLHDGKAVVVTTKPTEIEDKIRVSLEGKFVYLVEKNTLNKITSALQKHTDCVMIIIHSPTELEATPGVVAFLTTLLAEQNINIIEFISCWTDTIIVVDKKDSLKAYEILSSVVG